MRMSSTARTDWHRSPFPTRAWLVGIGLLGAMVSIAILPPFVSPSLRAVVMEGFSSVCHQLPGRSPHLHGVPLAVCDRCLGIYVGLVLGSGATRWGREGWRRVRTWGLFPLAMVLVPVAIDWGAPVLGLWESVPLSRSLTGLLAGFGGGGVVADRILVSLGSESPPTSGG
jgi:uncharacterized membrane protein